MTTISQSITALPAAPDPATDTPEVFSTKGAASVLAQKGMAVELETFRGQVNIVKGEMVADAATATAQAIIATAQAVIATSEADIATAQAAIATAQAAIAASFAGTFTGTSTTSIAIGTGSKSVTTQTGKQYVTGAFVTIASSATPANYMYGTVTSYNSSNGVLIINSTLTGGSGTFASWNISLSGAPGAAGSGITPAAVGFSATGGTTPKTLTVDVDLTASAVATLTGAQTVTGKRIQFRVGSVTSSATPTINTDLYDIYEITALAVNITSMSSGLSGTPTSQQPLLIEITGTATRTIAWGAEFEASTVALPTTTVGTAMLSVIFKRNAATGKWRCMGVS